MRNRRSAARNPQHLDTSRNCPFARTTYFRRI